MQLLIDAMTAIDPDHSLPPELRLAGLAVMGVVMTWAVVGIRKSNETIRLAKQGQPSPHNHGGIGQYILLALVIVAAIAAYLHGTGGM